MTSLHVSDSWSRFFMKCNRTSIVERPSFFDRTVFFITLVSAIAFKKWLSHKNSIYVSEYTVVTFNHVETVFCAHVVEYVPQFLPVRTANSVCDCAWSFWQCKNYTLFEKVIVFSLDRVYFNWKTVKENSVRVSSRRKKMINVENECNWYNRFWR